MSDPNSAVSKAAERLVLSEPDAVAVLAYLVTAARTQLDEAAEYGPLRLLTAAQRLAEAIENRTSAPVAELTAAVRAMPPTATPSRNRADYVARLDAMCVAVAECLVELDRRQSPG